MKTHVLPRPSSLKTCNITYQTPFEETLETPVDLPNSEPATSQYIWTVAAGDLPTFSLAPNSVVNIGCFYTGGQNTNGTAAVVYLRMIKNGISLTTSNTSIATTYKWTISSFFYNIAVGDVLEIRLWSNAASGHNRSYQAHVANFTRISFAKFSKLLNKLSFSDFQTIPTLTGGSATSGNAALYLTIWQSVAQLDTTMLPYWAEDATYKLVRTYYGDVLYSNNSAVRGHATNFPYYFRNASMPTSISFRNLGEVD